MLKTIRTTIPFPIDWNRPIDMPIRTRRYQGIHHFGLIREKIILQSNKMPCSRTMFSVVKNDAETPTNGGSSSWESSSPPRLRNRSFRPTPAGCIPRRRNSPPPNSPRTHRHRSPRCPPSSRHSDGARHPPRREILPCQQEGVIGRMRRPEARHARQGRHRRTDGSNHRQARQDIH